MPPACSRSSPATIRTDELTAFSVGRLPSEPYRSFANEQTLNGMRIGVIREHMDKKVFNEADVEAIDLTERAIGDLRRLGATIVDPGAGGALFQSCIDKYVPLYRNRVFIEQFPNLFPVDSNGKPSTDRISQLVDMFFDPSLVPAGSTIRNIAAASNAGMTKYMLNRYLRERGDANIKSLRDLIDKSKFYRDIRPEAGFVDRKAALEEIEQQRDARHGERLSRQVCLSASRSAMHGARKPRRPGFSGGEHSRLYPGCTHRATVGRQDEFGLGPAGTTRFSYTVRPGGFHHSRV